MNQLDEENIVNLLFTEKQKQLFQTVITKKKAFSFNHAIQILETLIHSIIQDNIDIYRKLFRKEKQNVSQFQVSINENNQLTAEQKQLFVLSKLLNILVELYGQLTQYKKALFICEMNKKILHNLFFEIHSVDLIKMLALCYAKTAKSNFFLSQYKKCEQDFVFCRSMLVSNKLDNTSEYASLQLIEGNYFRFMFRDAEAEKCYLAGSGLMRKIFGYESIQYADSCYGLANLYMDMGRFEDSIEIIEKALEIWRKQFPNELYPKISKSYYLLGNIYLRKGKSLARAKENFEHALKINLKLDLEVFQDTADIYHLIGRIYAEDKNKELFENYFDKSLKISQKLNGKKHSFNGIVFNHLGQAYQSLNMDYEAKECYEKAIEIYLETCGPHHLNCQFFNLFIRLISCIYIAVAITYKKCGECNNKLQLFRSALSNFQNAIQIYLEKYDKNWIGVQDLNKSIQILEKKIED